MNATCCCSRPHTASTRKIRAAEGIVLLREFRARPTFPAVLAVAEDGNELTAVRAMQLGALDYLPKRLLTPERLKTAVRLALRRVERRASRRLAKLAQSGEHSRASRRRRRRWQRRREPRRSRRRRDLDSGLLDPLDSSASPRRPSVYLAQSECARARRGAEGDARTKRDAEQHQMLAREYEAISNISHPAIVELHDYGVHAGREYLAMEYFPRGDLKARMYQGITRRRSAALRGAHRAALRVVHHAGILHRDLKPPNVMLRENDDVALIDFGLARNLEGGLQSTRTGVLRGSPYYMSPEQALGEELDARTDLYSLGIIFYEMLTGRKPFSGSSAIEVLQEHVNAPVPQLPERYAHYQPLLDAAAGEVARRALRECRRSDRSHRDSLAKRAREPQSQRGRDLALRRRAPASVRVRRAFQRGSAASLAAPRRSCGRGTSALMRPRAATPAPIIAAPAGVSPTCSITFCICADHAHPRRDTPARR